MSGPFGDTFLASPPFERIVPLELPRGYRDAASEERDVVLLRFAGCDECAGAGCRRCAFVGWSVERFVARVAIPHGATPGTRIVVPDANHVLHGEARELVVEIVQPGPRAEQLSSEAADYEAKLVTAWQMDEALYRRTRRKLQLGALLLVSLIGLACVVHWVAKAPAGDGCTSDRECRSGTCMSLLTATRDGHAPRLDHRICTASCETDLDCPHDMHCTSTPHETPTSGPYVQNAPFSPSCIPDGY